MKAGDKVICVDAKNRSGLLTENKVYTIVNVSTNLDNMKCCKLKETSGMHRQSRFKLQKKNNWFFYTLLFLTGFGV